jgi:hypothetical protein
MTMMMDDDDDDDDEDVDVVDVFTIAVVPAPAALYLLAVLDALLDASMWRFLTGSCSPVPGYTTPMIFRDDLGPGWGWRPYYSKNTQV